MTSCFSISRRFLLTTLLGLLSLTAAQAQIELKTDGFSHLFVVFPGGAANPVPTGTTPPTLTPQFAAEYGNSGGSKAYADSEFSPAKYPSQTYVDPATNLSTVVTVLRRSTFGSSFAPGVPRYLLGDTIVPPSTDINGTPLANSSYWRAQPVEIGEGFIQTADSTTLTPIPLTVASVKVTAGGSGYTSAPTVVFTSSTGSGAAATAVVTNGVVTSITLTAAGSGYRTLPSVILSGGGGTSAAAEAKTPALGYYWSPHAQRVLASQSGRVVVTWVTSVPVTTTTDNVARFRTRDEAFSVSSTTAKPTRTIYWTERSFNGPIVNIPTGRIERVNPVYSGNFPESVTEEYRAVGASTSPTPGANPPAELRTLWYDNTAGLAQLHAYNIEGRILLEYLGPLRTGSTDVHEFLGADIVDVVRVAPTINVPVNLGEQITPRNADNQLLPLDRSQEYLASPVLNLAVGGASYYGTVPRPDGLRNYFAERTTDSANQVVFYWLEKSDAALYYLPPPATPNLGIYWPKVRNAYTQVWPDDVRAFANYTVPSAGSTANTGLLFPPGQSPQIIFQDDGAQTETVLDPTTQRLTVTVPGDQFNRTLLKFISGNNVWYVRLFTQAEDRPGFQEGDGLAALAGNVQVGDRILAPSGYSPAGYIASGTNYLPAAYVDPFTGVSGAEAGAIIPVNAMPDGNALRIWWFKRIDPPTATFQPFYVPAKIGTYTISYPTNPSTIVLASNNGSGDLPPAELAGSIYYQNDRTKPGFNPNEEHALMMAGRAYALRDDLNLTTGGPDNYTSEPYVLLAYRATDNRPAVHAFKVLREVPANGIRFDFPVTAGTILQPPMPLPLLPLPVDPITKLAKNIEVAGTPDSTAPNATAPGYYAKFTFKDRKGYDWVYRGPLGTGGTPSIGMQFYYPMREGFFIPGAATQPAVGTILPYLRPVDNLGAPIGDAIVGTPLTLTYRPAWPTSAPELRVAETLTQPKFGLPAVYSQTSANVLYQQSVAENGATNPSVVLHDPIREKIYLLSATGLTHLPASIATTSYQGKTYFQGLPPNIQSRFFFDPNRGTSGGLVLQGVFVDEVAGEDYLDLNVLSADDKAALEGLPATADTDRMSWIAAVAALNTAVETFIEDPGKAGTYKSNGSPKTAGPQELAVISDSDTAVAKYALTATGTGEGWVTMIFGNGRAFTPSGEPVTMQIFKVAKQLYTGELKIRSSLNPLDEKVSLRHSGDFAGKPEDYEFEWRYAPPSDGVAPAIYRYTHVSQLAIGYTLVANPASALPTAAEYSAGLNTSLPRGVTVNALGVAVSTSRPGLVARSNAGVDFTAGVPAQIIFSADLDDLTGFVLYVNGTAAVAYKAPTSFANVSASTGLVLGGGGLTKQFDVSPNFFRQGPNTIEVALYATSDAGAASTIDFRLHASTETDLISTGPSPWTQPLGTLTNQITVGGSASAPLGNPLLVMTDNYFTMHYRPKVGKGNVLAPGTDQNVIPWSRWMPPKLVEGWIKRVLAGINPFNQRVKDLYNNAVNTDVSILTQAGKRWEGDVALNLTNINDFGLIEIYETVLNRGKNLSIDSGFDYGPANDALLLAAGYLNDLYTVLGNEAYADAANPTISIDANSTITDVNTSRFSFEGQVPNVLEEELALLRGRDDFLAPGVTVAPAYNRLYWNYTRGINSGEAIYAVNYNIREKSGSPTADGVLDAADAQRMFPQGHGDAYGHYLTALKGYQRLLRSPNFTWTPRSEAVTVLGQTVQIDYFDERKFASAAASVARTAQQILALTHRQNYKDDPAAGWGSYRDGKVNASTGITRYWGVDEWASRATQGAYYNWIVGNAILPDKDTNPAHTGVQIIDRTTVPELLELTTLGADFQTQMDNINAHLNPLGLSPGAIAFDISAADLKAGKSHYEQVYQRALRAALNAKGAFDQAGKMTQFLRSQENQVSDYNNAIVDQETAYNRQLIEIYGTPYPGEVGPGKTYAQDYDGPDLLEWFIVDRPTDLIDTTKPTTVSVKVPTGVISFPNHALDPLSGSNLLGALSANDVLNAYTGQMATRTLQIQPNRYVQYSDAWQSGASMGLRSVTGTLQESLSEVDRVYLATRSMAEDLGTKYDNLQSRYDLTQQMIKSHILILSRQDSSAAKLKALSLLTTLYDATADAFAAYAADAKETSLSLAEFAPKSNGVGANDMTSSLRGTIEVSGNIGSYTATAASLAFRGIAKVVESVAEDERTSLEHDVTLYGFSYEEAQMVYEYQLMFRDITSSYLDLSAQMSKLQSAMEKVRNLIATGARIQTDRQTFRQRAAAVLQGYRTKDVTFRTFRNEALEQYRALFDLASRYSYLAAKSYDYETGLLGTAAGQTVLSNIVASRALGDLTGGTPQATTSTTGDAGLAGTMARMQADWSVVKGRLGINNPDVNGTLFSLRRELFRIIDSTAEDATWQQALEQHIVSNLLSDPDVAASCLNLKKADGSAVPGIVIPFSSTIQGGYNFFGLPLSGGDHAFTQSSFATKIFAAGAVFRGYVGMDPYAAGTPNAGSPASTAPNVLSATPYVYLIPVGSDYMQAPPLGGTGVIRSFDVKDQALPLPFNLGATSFSTTQFFNADGTLSEQPWVLRKHQSFRAVNDPAFFYTTVPVEFTSSRLVGRSVWNSGWKLVIPANTLLNNEQEGLNRFVASVRDIEIFLRTYSNSGN